MTDNLAHGSSDDAVPQVSTTGQIVNGTHPIIQNTKADFKGLASSVNGRQVDDNGQPISHFHGLFYDLFTWKFPKATGFFFFSTISLIFAFRYVNVLRYVFKAAYMLFAAVAGLEIVGKPLGVNGVVSSLRPKRYYTVRRESLDLVFEQIHELANFFVLEFQRVVFVENIFATLAAFVTSFFGYFLIKYIPFWALLLLGTVTAFTAPLIYINNKEAIDEQLQHVSQLVNARLEHSKKLTEQYAGEAAARAKATAAELQSKVQGYTHSGHKSPETKKSATSPVETVHSTASARDILSDAPDAPKSEREFPSAPTKEPSVGNLASEPLLA